MKKKEAESNTVLTKTEDQEKMKKENESCQIDNQHG